MARNSEEYFKKIQDRLTGTLRNIAESFELYLSF